MFDSVRTRLTVWYVGVLALVLIAFCAGVYLLLARDLHHKLDAELTAAVDGAAQLLERELAEGESEQQVMEELSSPRQSLSLFDGAGKLLVRKNNGLQSFAQLPAGTPPPSDAIGFVTLTGTEPQRIAVRRLITQNRVLVIVISQSLKPVTEQLKQLRDVLLIAVPIALLLAGLGGWLLARKSLAPMVAMSAQARRISSENLNERLPIANPRDELGTMAATCNEMLARLEASFAQQRQFMADASHELRTPLHVVRTAAEVTLEQAPRTEAEYREAMAMVSEQARRLTRIVEDMFTLARADAGQRELTPTDFYLDELVAETARAAEVLAKNKNIELEVHHGGESLYRGDEGLLRQMLLNLLDNAIRHTPGGGQVRIALTRQNVAFEINVTDTGRGIPPEAQPHIFERFFRVDKARTRSEQANGSGAGLGLAIARWIAESHQGRLELGRSDAFGTNFRVTLPFN